MQQNEVFEAQLQDFQTDTGCRRFKFYLVSKFKVNIECLSFAFNRNSTIVFAGKQDMKVQTIGFNNKLKLIQSHSNHAGSIFYLIFLRKYNQLILVINNAITIKQIYEFKECVELNGHSDWISCIIINKEEDLLISGSLDKTIKFWKKTGLTWICSQTINLSFSVYSLSLNLSQIKLVSCGKQNEIIIIEYQTNKNWIITQRITIEEQGLRLCFINDNIFVFQPIRKGFLEIYSHQQENNQFIISKQILTQKQKTCGYWFPCQFIESKNILMVKHGNYINFFGMDKNDYFVQQESIEFDSDSDEQGRLRDDGQFLVTWDMKSEEVQVRLLQYLE